MPKMTYKPEETLKGSKKSKENLRLRKAVADLTLNELLLEEAAKGNF